MFFVPSIAGQQIPAEWVKQNMNSFRTKHTEVSCRSFGAHVWAIQTSKSSDQSSPFSFWNGAFVWTGPGAKWALCNPKICTPKIWEAFISDLIVGLSENMISMGHGYPLNHHFVQMSFPFWGLSHFKPKACGGVDASPSSRPCGLPHHIPQILVRNLGNPCRCPSEKIWSRPLMVPVDKWLLSHLQIASCGLNMLTSWLKCCFLRLSNEERRKLPWVEGHHSSTTWNWLTSHQLHSPIPKVVSDKFWRICLGFMIHMVI